EKMLARKWSPIATCLFLVLTVAVLTSSSPADPLDVPFADITKTFVGLTTPDASPRHGRIPVLLIHGFGDEQRHWETLVSKLDHHPEIVSRYKFYCYSFPYENHIKDNANQLRAAIEHYSQPGYELSGSGIVVVAYSMGGLV